MGMTAAAPFVLILELLPQEGLEEPERAKLEELVRALDADDAAARDRGQQALEAYLDREPRARWVRERIKSVEGEVKARLQKALDRHEFRTSEHVAFVRDGQLWVMSANGRSDRMLSDGGDNRSPAFSPDGRTIAFSSDRTGKHEVYLTDLEGKNVRQVTRSSSGAFDPVFTPDGKRVVYSVDGSGPEIRSVDLQGGEPAELAETGEWPSISPDGARLLFTVRSRAGEGQVTFAKLGEKTTYPLTDVLRPKALNFHPRYSPDGQRIVFAGWTPSGPGGLYLMDGDGKNLAELQVPGQFYAWPSFSPDGRRLLYCRSPEVLQGIHGRVLRIAKPELVVCDLDGKNETVLGPGSHPAWGAKVRP